VSLACRPSGANEFCLSKEDEKNDYFFRFIYSFSLLQHFVRSFFYPGQHNYFFHLICSSNATGPGIVEEASNSTWTFQCFPLYTMLLALGNPR
jgi:hypothetical protein